MHMFPTYPCLVNQNLWSWILESEFLKSALHDVMFMELLKLLNQGDLFHFFLFKTSLPQFFHQAQHKARQFLHILSEERFFSI